MQHSIAFAPRLTYKRHPLIKGEKALLCFKNLTCWASSNAHYQAGLGVPKGCSRAQGHLPASDTRAGSYLWQEVLSRAPHTPHLLISNNQDTDDTMRNVRLHWNSHLAESQNSCPQASLSWGTSGSPILWNSRFLNFKNTYPFWARLCLTLLKHTMDTGIFVGLCHFKNPIYVFK